jgi:hypothetical protein
MTKHDDAADFVPEAFEPDPLRSAFGYAMAALIEHLPEGPMRDFAVAETMEAHTRATAALRGIRRLH